MLPHCEVLLDGCLQVLSPQLLSVSSAGQEQGSVPTERRISLLLEHFRTTRVLVILDNLECLLEEGDVRGHFRPGFEGYGQLLRRVAETMSSELSALHLAGETRRPETCWRASTPQCTPCASQD